MQHFLEIGGTQRLPRLVGPSVAKDIILMGRRMNGIDAERVGLANYVVSQNESRDAAYIQALQLAQSITQKVKITSNDMFYGISH